MADKYIKHFSNLVKPVGDWDETDPNFYTLTIEKSEHGISNPIIEVFRLEGTYYIEKDLEEESVEQSNDQVVIKVPKTPIGLFNGRIVLA